MSMSRPATINLFTPSPPHAGFFKPGGFAMNDMHPVFAAALAPFAPPDAFTDAQLLEADRYLAGPARDPQFFDRKTELYEQRSQQEAERLELLHIREAV